MCVSVCVGMHAHVLVCESVWAEVCMQHLHAELNMHFILASCVIIWLDKMKC